MYGLSNRQDLIKEGKTGTNYEKKSVAALTYTVTVRYYGLNSTM